MNKNDTALVVGTLFISVFIFGLITSASAGIDTKYISSGGDSNPQVACETIAWGSGRQTTSSYVTYVGSVAYTDTLNQHYRAGYSGWVSSFKAYSHRISGSYPLNENPNCQFRINGTTITNGTLVMGLSVVTTSNAFVNYDKNAVTFGEQDRVSVFWNNVLFATGVAGVGCQVVICREI